jgi:hypothetical protein
MKGRDTDRQTNRQIHRQERKIGQEKERDREIEKARKIMELPRLQRC